MRSRRVSVTPREVSVAFCGVSGCNVTGLPLGEVLETSGHWRLVQGRREFVVRLVKMSVGVQGEDGSKRENLLLHPSRWICVTSSARDEIVLKGSNMKLE